MGDSSFSVERLRELVVSASKPDPLERLSSAVNLALELEQSGDQLVDGFVSEARDAGCSWAQVGVALGVSKQAAQQRFGFVTRVEPGLPPGLAVMYPRPEWLGALPGELLTRAEQEARELGHNYVGTEHMLLALLADPDSDAGRALSSLGVTTDRVRERVLQVVPFGDQPSAGQIPLTPRAKKVLELAWRESLSLGQRNITPGRLLLGLAHERDGVAMHVLVGLSADESAIRTAVLP